MAGLITHLSTMRMDPQSHPVLTMSSLVVPAGHITLTGGSRADAAYSLLNRWIEGGLTDVLAENGMGAIAFTALAQGLLTDKYLDGSRDVQRAAARPTFNAAVLTEETLARVRGLNEIAKGRGQTLAQMALVWVLRDPRIASTLVGTSSVAQLAENLAALDQPDFTAEELAKIDRYAVDSGIDLWRSSSNL